MKTLTIQDLFRLRKRAKKKVRHIQKYGLFSPEDKAIMIQAYRLQVEALDIAIAKIKTKEIFVVQPIFLN
ncbi:MAG: hypothetical protein ACK4JX_04455 [Flavobacterium sp.]